MSDGLKIGADDPEMGAAVADAHEKQAIMEAAPGAALVGRALAVAVAVVGGGLVVGVGVCVILGLVWVAVRLAGAL